jgi:hypothetical protein
MVSRTTTDPLVAIRVEYDDAVDKAWANLARYKFSNFGYWSSRVVFLGQLLKECGGPHLPNPFKSLVHAARQEQARVANLEAIGDDLAQGIVTRDQALRDARIAIGAEYIDDSEERAIDAAADHNAPVWHPGDDEVNEDDRGDDF